MGTIRINPSTVNETGAWSISAGTPITVLSGGGGNLGTPTHLVTVCGFPQFVTISGTYNLECLPGSSILIDGVLTDVNSLPSGFRIISLNVISSGGMSNSSSVSNLKILYNLTPIFNNSVYNGSLSFSTSISLFGLTPLDLFTSHWEFDSTLFDGFSYPPCGQLICGAAITLTGLYITGTYDLLYSSSSVGPNPLLKGAQVTITADSGLDTITKISIKKPDNTLLADITVFNSQSPTSLVFILSYGASYSGDTYVFGNTPSGSVLIGKLTVLIASASGIYTLVKDKTNDTVYTTLGANTTMDVAIPNPFFKTGFIDG